MFTLPSFRTASRIGPRSPRYISGQPDTGSGQLRISVLDLALPMTRGPGSPCAELGLEATAQVPAPHRELEAARRA